MSNYCYRGVLTRGEDDTVKAVLENGLGFTIHIRGTRREGGYDLVGIPGPYPEWSILPGDEVGGEL